MTDRTETAETVTTGFVLDIGAPNIVPIKYRQVALAFADIALDEASLQQYFVGKEAYMRTRFVVVRNGDATALVEVSRPPSEALFSDLVAVRLVAGPDDCVYVEDASVDVGIPSQLARLARAHPDATCIVVEGLYSHVSFIANPEPLEIAVLDIVPPEPSKLMDQTRRVLDVGEDLPPIVLTLDSVDSLELLDEENSGADCVLMPCRTTGAVFGDADVAFLDQRPERADWTVLGCDRTRQIHRWFYGDEAPSVDTCPKRFLSPGRDAAGVTLTRCCLLQEGMEQHGRTVVIPWGSTLAEVRAGIESIVESEEFRWTPV